MSPISTIKQDCKSGVVSLCWMEIPDQNMIMNLNILRATIRSFKMLIDYTLDLTPPSPPKEREDEEIATSTGIVVTHVVIANTPSKIFRLHLGKNFLSFDWDLLAFSFSNLFLFSSPPPPPPPPMLLLKSSHQSWVPAMLHHEWRELASDWLNCSGKPFTCYDTEVGQFDYVKGNWCCDCGTAKQKLSQWLKI